MARPKHPNPDSGHDASNTAHVCPVTDNDCKLTVAVVLERLVAVGVDLLLHHGASTGRFFCGWRFVVELDRIGCNLICSVTILT